MNRWLVIGLIAVLVAATGCNSRSAAMQAVESEESAAPSLVKVEPPPVVADQETFRNLVTGFLQKHCLACHGPDKPKGGLRLDSLNPDFVNKPHAAVWVEVMDRLNLGEMPPKERLRPDAKEQAVLTRWIASELRVVEARAQSNGGRVLARRLNRSEYANTVRDLLDVLFVPGASTSSARPCRSIHH
jgi:mono/diheme cytochrome c family protein